MPEGYSDKLKFELIKRMNKYLDKHPTNIINAAKAIGIARQTYWRFLQGKKLHYLTLRRVKKFLIERGF